MSIEQLTEVDALAQLSFLLQEILGRHAGEQELSLIQTRLLGILRDRQPTMQELARLLGLDKSSVSGLVDRAERRGLVERVRSETDGRSVIVTLTERGRGFVTAVAAGFAADVEALLSVLSGGERAALTALATRLLLAYAQGHGFELSATADKPGEIDPRLP